ncbi:hypothetical protein FB567DRAFT_627973 [Paraphoma chrysanthemicola]|uniref:Uncharacterized protein n=1 Tax=Paraphoma chrysanthemicola TaxID=798071 RepID=A0A8K0R832_9PLEO|nr:hypothetical protein FB567DRAFT_627973 [Paraphoma chrysanthemicola]
MSTTSNPTTHQASAWFSSYPNFTYDPSTSLPSNFTRLATAKRWGPKLKYKRWIACQTVLFDALYGTDVTKLDKWQDLCREVGITDVPGSIKKCKKSASAGQSSQSNRASSSGEAVIRFRNYDEFWKYTSKGRKFPLQAAKEDGFIKILLRKV